MFFLFQYQLMVILSMFQYNNCFRQYFNLFIFTVCTLTLNNHTMINARIIMLITYIIEANVTDFISIDTLLLHIGPHDFFALQMIGEEQC